MADFFISYTQVDREWAEWIAWVLEEENYEVRLQVWDFPAGSNFVAEMDKAIRECDRTLAVLSPDYRGSPFAQSELFAALARDPVGEKRKVVPVRVREVEPEGVLAGLVYIDLVGLGAAAARKQLIRGVLTGRHKPEASPRFPGPGTSQPPFPGPAASPPGVDEALARLEELPLEKVPDPAALPSGSRMPHAANPMFVGRDDDLLALARALKVGESAAIGQIAAATGLGGIGKTQLASELVHRYGQFFQGGIFWMSFAEPASVPTEVAACGRSLELHPQFAELPLDQQVQLVRDSWQSPTPRLLVFDNCEDPELLQEWRPTSGWARVLLTSQRSRWDPAFGIHSFPLGVLSRPASIDLLRRFRPDLAQREPKLGEIAQELGDLPLALHLAGSFLRRFQHSRFGQPQNYLEELRCGGLLDHPSLQGERAVVPTSHDAHVARTFALSLERLDPEDSVDVLAQRLLARASFFAPGEPIPRDLLAATLRLEGENPSALMAAEEALERLIDLGLLEEGKDGRILMHRLVAFFGRDKGQEAEDRQAVESAVVEEANRLIQAGDPAPLLAWQAHLRAVMDVALACGDEPCASLCTALTLHLRSIGDYAGARPYAERALAILEDGLGPEDPNTTAGLNNLASLLQDLGDHLGARHYFERALAIKEKAIGPDHPDTGVSLNNLGRLLREMGDFAAARPYLERALAIWEQVLGPKHPTTAVCLNNLGLLLAAQGDLSGARHYHERALAIRKQVQGLEHRDTAVSLNCLGCLLHAQGDLSGARLHMEQAQVIYEKVLGPQHPDTAVNLSNLGVICELQDDLSGARRCYERALAIQEEVLGSEHPKAATTLNNLAGLLQKVGDFFEARLHYERALAISERAMGPEHPETAKVLNNLGFLLGSLGDLPGALRYMERALAICTHRLGPDHPDTVQMGKNVDIASKALAIAEEAGKPAKARKPRKRLKPAKPGRG